MTTLFVFLSSLTFPSVSASPTMKRVLFALRLVTRKLATGISPSLYVVATVTSRVPWSVRRSQRSCPQSDRRPSAFCLGAITSSRQTGTCQELRCKLQLPVLCGRRVELSNHHSGRSGHNDFATPSGHERCGWLLERGSPVGSARVKKFGV